MLAPIAPAAADLSPRASTGVRINANLEANAGVLTSAFSHLAPVSSFQTHLGVRDSAGSARTLTVYFRKTASNVWQWIAGTRRGALDMAGYGGSFVQGGANFQTQFVAVQSGTLTFNFAGALVAESTTAMSLDFDQDGNGVLDGVSVATPQIWRWANGAASAELEFDFGTPTSEGGLGTDATTQYGTHGTGFVRSITSDGHPYGTPERVVIDRDGRVTTLYTNGVALPLSQIALARFGAPASLAPFGSAGWLATSSSGDPQVRVPGEDGLGITRSGFLEEVCGSDLLECLEGGAKDADGDGIPDRSDLCPGTPGLVPARFARPTTRAQISINLDAEAAVLGSADGFDPLSPTSTSSFHASLRAHDGSGRAARIHIYFRRTETGWHWFAGARREDLEASAYGLDPARAPEQFAVIDSGELRFSRSGELTAQWKRSPRLPVDRDGDGVAESRERVGGLDWSWRGASESWPIEFSFGDPLTEGGSGVAGTTRFSGPGFKLRSIEGDGHAPDWLVPAEVDSSGCSQGQFCSAVEIRTFEDLILCARSDWRNDEALAEQPGDCRLEIGGQLPGWGQLRCTGW